MKNLEYSFHTIRHFDIILNMKIMTYAETADEYKRLIAENYGDIIVYDDMKNGKFLHVHQCHSNNDILCIGWDEAIKCFINA